MQFSPKNVIILLYIAATFQNLLERLLQIKERNKRKNRKYATKNVRRPI